MLQHAELLSQAETYAKALIKPLGAYDAAKDQTLDLCYMFAKRAAEGYDALIQVSTFEAHGGYDNWYAIKGTPEQIAEMYHIENTHKDKAVFKLFDLKHPIEEQFPASVSPTFSAALRDPAIKERAQQLAQEHKDGSATYRMSSISERKHDMAMKAA